MLRVTLTAFASLYAKSSSLALNGNAPPPMTLTSQCHFGVGSRFARASARSCWIIASRYAVIHSILFHKIVVHFASRFFVLGSGLALTRRTTQNPQKKSHIFVFVTLNNNLGRRFGDSCTCMIIQACQICYMSRKKINKSLHFLDFVI